MAPLHAAGRSRTRPSAPDPSPAFVILAATRWTACAARQAAALRHRQGRRRQDDRRRRARAGGRGAPGRRTIVCEVAEQDRVSRAFAPRGRRARDRGRSSPTNLWAITIDPQRGARRSGSRKQLGGARRLRRARALARRSSTSSPPRRARKELITIAKVWELAQLERWDRAQPHLRPRDRRRAGLRPRARDAHRRRARSARSPASARSAARPYKIRDDARRPARAPATWPSRWPRRCRSTRRSSSAARLEAAVGLGLDADRRQRPATPSATRTPRPESLRAAAANGLDPEALAAVRAALTQHERSRQQQTHVRRLRKEAGGAGARAAHAVRARGGAGGVRAPGRGPPGGAGGLARFSDCSAGCPPASAVTRRTSTAAGWGWVSGGVLGCVGLFDSTQHTPADRARIRPGREPPRHPAPFPTQRS